MLPHGKLGQSPTGIVLIENEEVRTIPRATSGRRTLHLSSRRVFLEEINGVLARCGVFLPGRIQVPEISPWRLADAMGPFSAEAPIEVGGPSGTGRRSSGFGGPGKTPLRFLKCGRNPKGFQLRMTEPVDLETADGRQLRR